MHGHDIGGSRDITPTTENQRAKTIKGDVSIGDLQYKAQLGQPEGYELA